MSNIISAEHRAELQSNPIPVYRRYPSQVNPQGAYIVVDPEEECPVYADYSGEIGNAVTASYWHRREQHIAIPAHSLGSSILEFIDEHAAELAKIVAGYECIWDGSNHVGRWSEEAIDLLEKLEKNARNELSTLMVCDSPSELDLSDITATTDPEAYAQEVWGWLHSDSPSPDDYYPDFDRDDLVEYVKERVAKLKEEDEE